MKAFVFTPEDLLKNIHKLGGWSAYGLAREALMHYFPNEYDEEGSCDTQREVELLHKLGCKWWSDAIKKYHKEVGYKGPFDPGVVNEF